MNYSLLNINNLILFVTFIINAALGYYIYMKDRYSRTNQSFSMVILCLSIWTVGHILWALSTTEFSLHLWIGATFMGPALVAGFFLYFAIVFPKRAEYLDIRKLYSIFFPGIVLAIASFTPLIVKDISLPYIEPPHGIGYPFYIAYLILYFAIAFILLFKKYLQAKDKEKLQLLYVFIGAFLTAFIGILANGFLATFNISSFGPIMVNTIGPASSLFLVFFVSYAIAKYKLLNVEDFIARAAFYCIFLIVFTGTLIIISSGLLDFLFHFYIIVANISLGSYIFFQNKKDSINRSFIVFTFFITFWVLCDYLAVKAPSASQALFWSKVILIGGAFIPSTFLYFTFAFLKKMQRFTATSRILLFVPGIVFSLILPTNLMVYDVELLPWGIKFIYGPLAPLYTIYFIFFAMYAFYNLAIEYRIAHGLKRAQIGYLFLGTTITAFIGSITNLVLPLLFGIVEFHSLGPPSTIVMIGFIFYSIVKHRLMNIEFVIQKGLIYSMLTILIMAAYGMAILLSQEYLSRMLGYGTALVIVAAAVIVAVTYQPVLNTLQEITDRIFFRARYDYQRTLRDISKALASVMRIKQLARYIVEILVDTIKVGEISFLLYDPEKDRYKSIPVEYKKATGTYKKIEIDSHSPIINYLRVRKLIQVTDELDFEITEKKLRGGSTEDIKHLEELKDELDRLGIAVWVPVISKNELISIIALGYKLSGDMYTEEDLRLLITLSNQVAISLENSRLYEEILNTKNYSENILQSITSGVVTTDLSGKVVTFNKTFEVIVGSDRKHIEGKDIYQVFDASDALKSAIKDVFSGKEIKNAESIIVKTGGETIPISLTSIMLKDSLGKNTGLLFMFSDLSEMKVLEGRVRQADKLAALGTMAAGMAHEIKNPLSAIKVFSQLLLDRYNDEEYRKKFSEIVPREVARIDRIVESLLSFARASQPKLKQCNITNIIDELLKDYSEQISRSDIKVNKTFGDVPEVMADQSQLMQAFSNLILNSLQAMPSGGTLDIAVKIETETATPYIRVIIADNGHGIPKDNLQKLFDPFFTTKHGGTGLGLTIAHSIIEGHKGTITVKSEIGKGTSFIITIPVSL